MHNFGSQITLLHLIIMIYDYYDHHFKYREVIY